jgi:hypothetical protein
MKKTKPNPKGKTGKKQEKTGKNRTKPVQKTIDPMST